MIEACHPECWPLWQKLLGIDRLRLGLLALADFHDPAGAAGMSCLAAEHLGPEEQEQFARFSLEKRRAQWLGGRLCAKWAATGLLGDGKPVELRIGNSEGGAPRVFFTAPVQHRALPRISISHSGCLAAALASDLPCGLDLQGVEDKILRLAAHFSNPIETDLLTALPRSCSKAAKLTLLWAVKEAVRKMDWPVSPLPAFTAIRLCRLTAGQSRPENPSLFTLQIIPPGEQSLQEVGIIAFYSKEMAWALGVRPQRNGAKSWNF